MMPLPDRFWQWVEQDDSTGCWEWTGGTLRGYGQFQWRRTEEGVGRTRITHRLVWEFFEGPAPEGLEPDHLCENRGCCNPGHIEWVTHAENCRRAVAKITHCPSGHEYTDENTYLSKRNQRNCLRCAAKRERDKRARKKEQT